MSAEDRLREILRSEASTVVPAGDGLALIRERATRRRRLTLLLVPGAALVTAAAVVAVFAFGGQPGRQELNGPAQPSPTATGVVAPYRGPALWPFTSVEQGQAWMTDHGARPWAGDSLAVAQHFVHEMLRVDDVTASGTGPSITLRAQGRMVGVLRVVQVFQGGPWTVAGVCCTDLRITSPSVGEAVSSPTQVVGRVTGVDESIYLRLITATGRQLALTYAPAGGEVPWVGTLTWNDSTWFTGGIFAITSSNKDGSTTRISVTVVKRGQ